MREENEARMRNRDFTRTEGSGRRGAIASGVGASDPVRHEKEMDNGTGQVQRSEAGSLARDRVRWGPVWAGLVTSLTSLVLLGLLGLAIGLTTVNAGTAAAQGGPQQDVGLGAAIWGALTGIVAFLLGGYVAGRTAAVFSRGWGALNGALVFLVTVPIVLWLASQGLGLVLGTMGAFVGTVNLSLQQVQEAARQAQQTMGDIPPIDVARTAEAARNAAWGTLIALLLGLGASALGGSLGARRGPPHGQAQG
jgi:hypothetical protein